MGKINKNSIVLDAGMTKDEFEFKAYENQKKLNEHQQLHQIRALSRRDFMATGVISFAGTLMSQSLFSMLIPRTAQAAIQCQVAGSSEWIPVVSIHLRGGAALGSHWVPTDIGGNLLPSYSQMGQGKVPSIDTEFANKAKFFSQSTFLTSLRAAAQPSTLINTNFAGISAATQDDSANTKANFVGMALATGLKGRIIQNMGTTNSSTGNANLAAFVEPTSPLIISNYLDIVGAIGVGDSLAPLVAAKRAGKMFETIQKLSTYQADKYAQQNGGADLSTTVTCRTQDNTSLVTNPDGQNTDPRSNAQVATVWGLAANTATSARSYVFAGLVYNALNGNGASADLEMGGYDNHNNTRTTGDAAEGQAGMVVGQILQTAAVLGKKVFINVTTDGAMASADSELAGSVWTNDAGAKSCNYMLYFNPSGAPTAAGSQLGYMNASQGAADPNMSAETAAAARFYNWLAANGKTDKVDIALPRTFSQTQLDAFRKIA